ncbi:MAG: IS1 family transposase, partial [Magnetococcus sp. DMHC-6]
MQCPNCDSDQTVKNGSRQNGKQNFLCNQCGRQFVENPAPHYQIPQGTKDLIDKLLLEKIPLAGIARVVGVSEK